MHVLNGGEREDELSGERLCFPQDEVLFIEVLDLKYGI